MAFSPLAIFTFIGFSFSISKYSKCRVSRQAERTSFFDDQGIMIRTGKQRREMTIAFAFALAIFSCATGLVMCFTKSPQMRSLEYVTIAQASLTKDTSLSVQSAWKAVRFDSTSQEAWQILSVALQLRGEQKASHQARLIASRIGGPDSEAPVFYAMPAEFRLSFLADTAGGF